MPSQASEPGQTDLMGRICIVTGATGGIGREISRELATQHAMVVMAGRNKARCKAVAAEITRETGNSTVVPMFLDLASRQSIRSFAESFTGRFNRLDILINNAAVWQPQRCLSDDGVELTWAVNVAAPHLLTWLLRDALRATNRARVINVASTMAGGLDLNDVEFQQRRYNGIAAYKQSKQALRMLTWEFAARLADSGVAVNAAHPGFTNTHIARNSAGLSGALTRLFFRCGQPPATGADTPIWLATAPEVEEQSGRFWARRRELCCAYRDPTALKQLWEVLCGQNELANSTC